MLSTGLSNIISSDLPMIPDVFEDENDRLPALPGLVSVGKDMPGNASRKVTAVINKLVEDFFI